MKLYFSPLACSLAARIVVYETGDHVELVHVDGKSKRSADGRDFHTINPLGLVPALERDDGSVVTENAAVLQELARLFPDARLAPVEPRQLADLQQHLCFIGTELHKAIYVPLLDKRAPEQVKHYALRNVTSRLRVVDAALQGRDYLLAQFSVADAYLFAVLNWSMVTPVDLTPYEAITAFQARMRERPHVARAFAEELEIYRAELAAAAP